MFQNKRFVRGLCAGVSTLAAAMLADDAALAAPPVSIQIDAPLHNEDDSPRAIPDLLRCATLKACLAMLDAVAPQEDSGAEPNGARAAARSLARFGAAAKAALLARAVGDQPGLRNYAGAVLQYWADWSPGDTSALAAALRESPGGWIARPLAVIGDDAAIEALADDLARAGADNQTTFALVKLAPRSLPAMLRVLAQPHGENSRAKDGALQVIADSGRRALPFITVWREIALDPRQPMAMRVAALQALAAVTPANEVDAAPLRPLMHDPSEAVAKEARETLFALKDPSLAAEVAANCTPSNLPFGLMPLDSLCVRDLAAFGKAQEVAGPALMRFLASRNGDEAAEAAHEIGQLGYAPAGPKLVDALHARDWRVVYAAAEALAALGPGKAPPGAVAALEDVAKTHWLPEVRARAQASLLAIRDGHPPKRQPPLFVSFGRLTHIPTEAEARHGCRLWTWRGAALHEPPQYKELKLIAPAGVMSAVDNGEWGGALNWNPNGGATAVLLKDNIQSVINTNDGVMALAGLAHLSLDEGYVVGATFEQGAWRLREVAQLPGQFYSVGPAGSHTYAAFSFDRVVVFTPEKILGLAKCAARN